MLKPKNQKNQIFILKIIGFFTPAHFEVSIVDITEVKLGGRNQWASERLNLELVRYGWWG